MPITKLDTNAALVVIDLQKLVVSIPMARPTSEVVARTARLVVPSGRRVSQWFW
jgi:hypothetical protein